MVPSYVLSVSVFDCVVRNACDVCVCVCVCECVCAMHVCMHLCVVL